MDRRSSATPISPGGLAFSPQSGRWSKGFAYGGKYNREGDDGRRRSGLSRRFPRSPVIFFVGHSPSRIAGRCGFGRPTSQIMQLTEASGIWP